MFAFHPCVQTSQGEPSLSSKQSEHSQNVHIGGDPRPLEENQTSSNQEQSQAGTQLEGGEVHSYETQPRTEKILSSIYLSPPRN